MYYFGRGQTGGPQGLPLAQQSGIIPGEIEMTYGIPGIEIRSATCKARILFIVLSLPFLVLLLCPHCYRN